MTAVPVIMTSMCVKLMAGKLCCGNGLALQANSTDVVEVDRWQVTVVCRGECVVSNHGM